MEDILDIYKTPYNAQRPPVCLNEMSTQLIGEARAPLPAEPGKPLRYDTEYKRKLGTLYPSTGCYNILLTERTSVSSWIS